MWGGGGGEMGGWRSQNDLSLLLHRKVKLLKREISERSARCNFEAVAQYSPLRQTRLAQDLHRDDDTKRPQIKTAARIASLCSFCKADLENSTGTCFSFCLHYNGT